MKKILLFSLIFSFFVLAKANAEGPAYCDQQGHCWYQNEDGTLYDNKGHYLYKRDGDSKWYDKLLEQGAVPAGTTPNVINAEGKMLGKAATDPLSRLSRAMDEASKERESKEDAKLEENKRKIEYYKKLLDAGYDKKTAWDAAMKNEFPSGPPNKSAEEDVGFVSEK